MKDRRDSPAPFVLSLLVAFGLGVIFGALGARPPRHSFAPRVGLAPGHPGDAGPVRSDLEQSGLTGSDHEESNPGVPDSVPGDGTATAPDGYPVKANSRSGIYHRPGGLAYNRTIATLHFRTPEAAEAAGYRSSKA